MTFKTLITTAAFGALTIGALTAGTALGWGAAGHRMIGEVAVRALPDYMPAFLRTPQAVADIGEYSREPDRWRGAGKVSDNDRTPAHFIDLDDDGKTLAGQTLDQLPTTRSDFDASMRAKSIDPYVSGYLPYSSVDAYQQVAKDFATWRVLSFLENRETDKARKAWYAADTKRREELIKRDIGVLSHYVGDGSQPLHVSIHYNGWGEYPNPNNFTQEHIHSPIEGAFVSANISEDDIRANMAPYVPCTDPVMTCFTNRLKRHVTQVVPLYQLEKDGGFKDGDPRGKAFIAARLGEGAGDIRDVILDAWRDSKAVIVGYKAGTKLGTYDDFVAGKMDDPWLLMHGSD